MFIITGLYFQEEGKVGDIAVLERNESSFVYYLVSFLVREKCFILSLLYLLVKFYFLHRGPLKLFFTAPNSFPLVLTPWLILAFVRKKREL